MFTADLLASHVITTPSHILSVIVKMKESMYHILRQPRQHDSGDTSGTSAEEAKHQDT